jgi:hypothetical protein
MASNNVKINIQGNEQRDAPINRDGKKLNNTERVDRPAHAGAACRAAWAATTSDRWYTGGGLLEVGGYLGTQGHTVGEWMAQGGAVSFGGGDVVTQAARASTCRAARSTCRPARSTRAGSRARTGGSTK